MGDLCEFDLAVLEWIKTFVISLGYPPTTREITTAFELSSTKLAHDILAKLAAYGFLDVDPGVTRGIRIHNLPPPEDLPSARLKLWVCEAASALRKHCPDAPGVFELLRKFSILSG